MRKLFFTSMLLAAGACSHISTAQVVGGNSIADDADFFCSLVDVDIPEVQPFCGAALIAPQWVLTAGHCVINFGTMQPETAIDIVVHPYYKNAPAGTYTRVHSDKIIPHPAFNMFGGSMEHDIALIKLATPVTNAETLGLPAQGNVALSAPGMQAYVVGYGVFDTLNDAIQPDTLQMANVDVISNDVCNEPNRYGGIILPTMVCAGKITGNTSGAGAGDSGGPLYVISNGQKIQIGVVSFGDTSFSTVSHPGIYTRVASHRAWIDSVINANTPTSVNEIRTPLPIISQGAGELVISFEESIKDPMVYTIYNISGQTLHKGTLQKGAVQVKLPTERFAQGMYFVHLRSTTGFSYSSKFLRSL